MIRCRLELLPGGLDLGEDNIFLGEIKITNDIFGTLATDGKRGTYNATIYKKRMKNGRRVAWKRIKLKNFPRKSYHPWEMVRRILDDAARQNGGHI